MDPNNMETLSWKNMKSLIERSSFCWNSAQWQEDSCEASWLDFPSIYFSTLKSYSTAFKNSSAELPWVQKQQRLNQGHVVQGSLPCAWGC